MASGERWRAAWVLPVSSDPIRDGAVAFRDGVIVDCGPAAEVARRHPELEERDLGESLIAPGFVDTHCHLEWSLLGGFLPPAPFAEWLRGMLPVRDRYPDGADTTAARLGALRCLQSGTTTVADSGPGGGGARAVAEAGLRGIVALEVVGRERGPAARERAERIAERVGELDEHATSRMTIGLAPHAPYSTGPELWAALAETEGLASRAWFAHVGESPAEVELLSEGSGPLAELFASLDIEPAVWPGASGDSPVARLAAAGALRSGLVAAHCVQTGRADAETLAAGGVGVAHCPTSNAYLRCGRAPLEALRAARVRVGLGTDSPASGGTYDVRAEARAAATGAGRRPPPSPAELLRMATLDGAGVLGLEGVVGELRPGCRADLLALAPVPGADSSVDPAAAVLDPASRPRRVAVDGQTLLDDSGPTLVDPGSIARAAAGARATLC